jgi:hypothetical protein
LTIQFIQATPGPRTDERILEFVRANPQGIAAKQISRQIDRPISMVQVCLKYLLSSGKVYCRIDKDGGQRVYYPKKISEKWFLI